jgi:hypothetical protein
MPPKARTDLQVDLHGNGAADTTVRGISSSNRLNAGSRDHHVEEVIRYLSNGTIASSDATFHDELGDVLNLNAAHLKNGRAAALHALQEMMKKRGTLNKQRWEKLLGESSFDNNGGLYSSRR